MAIIPQRFLFRWNDVDAESDLTRLKLVLEELPDEELMCTLENERGRGRNDYPIRPLWNSLLARMVFGHDSIESLRRELLRNAELRALCGFDPCRGTAAVPSSDAYSHFLEKLEAHQERIDSIFDELVRRLGKVLPDLGTHLAGDSKAIATHAAQRKQVDTTAMIEKGMARDRRRDLDADWGVKGKVEDVGGVKRRRGRWFGYKLNLVVDATYDIPLAFSLEKASASDFVSILPLLDRLHERGPNVATRGEDLALDRGYDSARLNASLFDDYGLKPIIARRSLWKTPDETKLIDPDQASNVEYDESGRLYCSCPQTHVRRKMVFRGFEKNRNCLKFQCPAVFHGERCKGRWLCCGERKKSGKIVRVPLSVDRRAFTPIARDTWRWKRLYRGRTSAERVNSRVDRSLGLERHFIRGLGKMRAHMALALSVMLAMASAWIRRGRLADRGRFQCLPKAA